MPIPFALDVCKLEIEAIEKEGGEDSVNLISRMGKILMNFRMATLIVARAGYQNPEHQDTYLDVKARFLELQKRFGISYDGS